MQICKRCGVKILGNKYKCPLCQGALTGDPSDDPFPVIPYPKTSKRSFFLIVTIVFLVYEAFLCIALASGFDAAWIYLLMLGCLLVWLDIIFSIYFRHNIIKMFTMQAAIGLIFAIIIDVRTGYHAWSVTWMIPIVIVILTIATVIISQASRRKLEDFIIYLLFDLVFAVLQIIPILLGKNPFKAPAVITMVVFVVSAVIILIFRFQNFKNASQKWFNI